MAKRVKRSPGFELQIDDTRLERLLVLVKDAPDLAVGVIGAKAGIPHGPSGETNASIMAKHEMGAGVPRRSWLRDWLQERRDWVRQRWTAAAVRAVDRLEPFEKHLDLLGLEMVGSIQQRIAGRIPPPNAQATIDAKGSDVPLIDTGQARTAITHKVG